MMLWEAQPIEMPELQLSQYPETHPDTRDLCYEARENVAELHRKVDTTGLSRHQVHLATKQIIALRTQIADLQETVFKYEKECAYLHDQAIANMAHHDAFMVARFGYEQKIKAAEERIANLTQFDSCRRCTASCARVKNMCRACIKVTKDERKAKATARFDAAIPLIAHEPKPSADASMREARHLATHLVTIPKIQPPPLPKPPRIIESEWSRDDAPEPEKSASGRRRAKRYTLMNF